MCDLFISTRLFILDGKLDVKFCDILINRFMLILCQISWNRVVINMIKPFKKKNVLFGATPNWNHYTSELIHFDSLHNSLVYHFWTFRNKKSFSRSVIVGELLKRRFLIILSTRPKFCFCLFFFLINEKGKYVQRYIQ